MNSIVFTLVAAPIPGASLMDAALEYLGAYLDAEIGSLEDLLDITGHEDAIDDLVAVRRLHLDAASTPTRTRQMLEDAQASLERLLERVRTIPIQGPLSGRGPSDFDVWLCRSGTRLQAILAALRHARLA